jgi:hypothetical protein
MTATDHNKILSILFFVKGGMLALAALILVVVYGLFGAIFGAALISAGKGEEKLIGAGVGGAFVVFAIIIGLFILMFAGLYFMAGWKLHKHQRSAKVWVTIASCLALLNFPLGTALGAYALWFVYGDMGKALYDGGPQGGYVQPPPPPHGWQQ